MFTPAWALQAQRNDAALVVRSLERDLNKKQALFDDDADFIKEVRTGQAVSIAGEHGMAASRQQGLAGAWLHHAALPAHSIMGIGIVIVAGGPWDAT